MLGYSSFYLEEDYNMAEKLDMKSMNITEDNVKKIQALFPNVVTEIMDEDGKFKLAIDFDALKQELSNDLINEKQERYQMTWPDKSKAKLLANSRISATLRPDKEKSVNFDTTKNLYIEGDNLDVLKLLRETYLGKIKMIYIDPPYNTGNDFVYEDDFAMSADEYSEISGEYDEQGNRLVKNLDSNGRFHTDWLNMIYPRLKVARDLLKDDGVIFISIDDNEQANLKKLCDEIFGSANCLSVIAKKTKLTSNNGNFFAPSHEYILVYAKNILCLEGFNDPLAQEDPEYLKLFKYEDDYSKYNIVGLYQPSLTLERSRFARYYIECPDGSKCIPPEGKRWRVIEPSYLEMLKKNLIVFKQTKTSPLFDENGSQSIWNIYTKIYLKDRLDSGLRPVTFLDKFPNSEASKELIKLNIPFDFSKSRKLIQYLMSLFNSKEEIILDFFSGSSSTAHAVMQLNSEDGGNRKFIMVQIPEKCDEKSEAYKAGYKTICEIGQERIRRAGEKIVDESGLLGGNLDVGFRVLKLDSSNMNDVYYNPNAFNQSMLDMTVDNVKADRTPLDLLFQVMLNLGVELSADIVESEVNGKKYYSVNGNDLIACFDDDIDNDVIVAIAEKHPLYAVFKDKSFSTDSVGINNEQLFKTYSPSTVVKVI